MPMILDGSNGLTMPTWTTTSRPTNPIIGAQGYNTTYGGVEVYNGSAWDLITGGPTFSAYRNANQSLSSGTNTKVQINTKSWDTANSFDASTNYRFTPTVAGYYQVSAAISFTNAVTGYATLSFYKNGSTWASCSEVNLVTSSYNAITGTCLIYLNGSTDYVELYVVTNGNAVIYGDVGNYTYFQGTFIRGQ